MLRNILITLIFSISFLFTLEAAGKTPDLTFNIPHTKSKADVYKTLINFFKENGEQYNCKIGSYKNFKKGTFDVLPFINATLFQNLINSILSSAREMLC